MDWIRDLDFFDYRDFNFLINWELFDVMMMNCMHFVGNFNLDCFTAN